MNILEEGVRLLAEERCRGCGARGEGLLCVECKQTIIETGRVRKIRYEEGMVCEPKEVFVSARFLGERDGILGEMVEEYKYRSRRGLGEELGEITYEIYFKRYLFEKRGVGEVILVPMPTARKHVRERGFDHTLSISRDIEKRDERIKVRKLLFRANDTVQVGASEEKRKMQAQEAVGVDMREVKKFLEEAGGVSFGSLPGSNLRRAVVLFDDVWTTGASLLYAGKKLKEGLREASEECERGGGGGKIYGLTICKNRSGRSPTIYGGKFA